MAKVAPNGFKIGKDVGGFPMYLLTNFCSGYDLLMTALTEYVVQVPAGINLAIFQKSPGTNMWIAQDDSPDATSITIPTGTFTLSEKELNKPGVFVLPGKYLHFKATENNFLKVNFYDTGTSQR